MPVFLRNLIFLMLLLGALKAVMALPPVLHYQGVVAPQLLDQEVVL